MIHVVTVRNQHLYAKQLDQMFRMRHAFYVVGHGWDGVHGRDGRETDEFDDDSAVYLIAPDPYGDVAVSLRLNPVAGPTLLKKLRDQYCPAETTLDDPEAWELSRWIARPEDRRGEAARWRTNYQRELMLGLLEFCEREGVSRLITLAELRLAERIKAYGWPIRYLAEPRAYEGGKGTAVAAEIAVGLDVLALTRAKTGILRPVLFEAPAAEASPEPIVEQAVAEAVRAIGADKLTALARALSASVGVRAGSETAAAVELIGALNRVLERFGAGLQDARPSTPDLAPMPQPSATRVAPAPPPS
jgi:acyl-homoserine lactone synthase